MVFLNPSLLRSFPTRIGFAGASAFPIAAALLLPAAPPAYAQSRSVASVSVGTTVERLSDKEDPPAGLLSDSGPALSAEFGLRRGRLRAWAGGRWLRRRLTSGPASVDSPSGPAFGASAGIGFHVGDFFDVPVRVRAGAVLPLSHGPGPRLAPLFGLAWSLDLGQPWYLDFVYDLGPLSAGGHPYDFWGSARAAVVWEFLP